MDHSPALVSDLEITVKGALKDAQSLLSAIAGIDPG
jgi:hypothetical protein